VTFTSIHYNLKRKYFSEDLKQILSNPNHELYHYNIIYESTAFDDKGSSEYIQSFLSWQHHLTKNIVVNSGMHYLKFNLNNDYSVEPRINMKWQINPNQSISMGFGQHSRIEALVNHLQSLILNNDTIIHMPNKNMKMTKAKHYIVGYSITPINSLRFQIEAYYQDIYNVPVDTNQYSNKFSIINISNGYNNTRSIYQNIGTARNYGIELTIEKPFSNNYYLLFSSSIFESKYTPYDGAERDTRYNSNYIFNLLAGKEYKVGRNSKDNLIGINIKSTWIGGQRYTPIDLERSIELGEQRFKYNDPYSAKADDYYRIDLQFYFRKNHANYTSEWRIDIQNLTNRNNVIGYYYNVSEQKIDKTTQIGIIPFISYRIEF
ncbi:TonB-dependent receptor domain-containing protein, partial [Bacteroidota bacterium]